MGWAAGQSVRPVRGGTGVLPCRPRRQDDAGHHHLATDNGLFGAWVAATVGMVIAEAVAIGVGRWLGYNLPEKVVKNLAAEALSSSAGFSWSKVPEPSDPHYDAARQDLGTGETKSRCGRRQRREDSNSSHLWCHS